MNLKVGDKIKVRSDLDEDERYDGYCICSEMTEYGGREVTISDVRDDHYDIKDDNNDFAWTDSMFESIKEERTLETMLVNLKAKVSIENYEEVKSQIEKLDEMLKNLKIKFVLE